MVKTMADMDLQTIIKQFADETRRILQENVLEEYLFGSFAKDTQTPESDIDILIIVRSFSPEMQYRISELASDYSLNHDVLISPIVRDVNSWEMHKNYNTLFYQEIENSGIRL